MKNYIENKIPLFSLDEEFAIYTDGSLGAGFTLTGFDISCTPPETVNSFSTQLESFLAGLPENVKVQVFYRLTNNVEQIVQAHKDAASKDDITYQPIADARYDFLNRKKKNGEFFVPEIYLFIRSASIKFKKRKFFEKKQKFEGFPEREFQQHKEAFSIVVSQAFSALTSAGLYPVPLSKNKWFDLCFSYFNFSRSEEIGFPKYTDPLAALAPSLGSQLALTDINMHEDYIEVGNLKFRAISLSLLPEGESFSSMIDRLMKLPFHFWMSQNIQTLAQKKEIEKLELSRRIAHSMVAGSKNVSDLESESKFTQIEELLRELMSGSERLVASDLSIVFWAEEKDELDRKTEEILRAFRAMNQSEGLVEKFALEDVFFRSAPSICEGFRHKKMKTSNCAHLMPLYSYWRGNERPVVLLANREGTPFGIDIYSKELPAWNGIIIGGTGSGKSFSVSQLMLQFCNQNPKPKIIWIDNGASSEKLIEVMNGEFIDLHLDSGICINMFDIEKGQTEPSSSKAKLILAVLELILKDESAKGLPKREKALLEEAIYKLYRAQPERTPLLSDLREALREHPVTEMRKYAEILFSWTRDTAYGKMLDRPTNVNLENDLITIEVKGLTNHSELKDAMFLLLTSHIQDMAAADLARPYMLICDEAERFFKSGELSKQFIITCYRTWRKYNASIWCLSQNYRDFLADPEVRDALLPNAPNVIILRQRKIDWDDFKAVFDFDDAKVEAIKSLEVSKGKYSEFFFIQDEKQGVVRLQPEPLSYWICTTDGNDKAQIQKLRSENPERPLIDVLVQLSKGENYSESIKVTAQ